jgi:hypothetical protein
MEIEMEIENVMKAISNFKINVCSIKKLEGCIICYSYPGKDDWNKKNTLTTNFCQECNVVLCSDCYLKIDGYKCPICHKPSHLKKQRTTTNSTIVTSGGLSISSSRRNGTIDGLSILRNSRISEIQTGNRETVSEILTNRNITSDLERINNNSGGVSVGVSDLRELISPIQRTPQENRRLRNQRYRQRKRARRSIDVVYDPMVEVN